MNCGNPTPKSTKRTLDVNKRLATGRGLPAEYRQAVGPGWKPGDPPPTLKRLTQEGLCKTCRDRTSRKLRDNIERKRTAGEPYDTERKSRRTTYADRRNRGVCGRCGKHPPALDSVECDTCREKREARALKASEAADIMKWLKAGETQAGIRRNRGFKRNLIEPLAGILKRRGEMPIKPGTAKKGTRPKAEKIPMYDDHIQEIIHRVNNGQTNAEIAGGMEIGVHTVRRWLNAAGRAGAATSKSRRRLRKITDLHDKGATNKEIGDAIGATPSTVQQFLARAGRKSNMSRRHRAT